MVEVSGRRVHVRQAGAGGPMVVFENGLGEDLSTWSGVQPAVANSARTLSYDRAGLGKSDPAPSSAGRDARQLAIELHELLRAVGEPGPYILVGHSLGGAVVQLFAHDYPHEVAGLVLVDPEDGRITGLLRARLPAELWTAREAALRGAMPDMPIAVRRELEALPLSGEQAALAFPLPAIPIVLLTGTLKNPEFPGNPVEQDAKLELHEELLERAPGIRHLLVPQSRHYIQNDVPEVVIDAIGEVLQEAM